MKYLSDCHSRCVALCTSLGVLKTCPLKLSFISFGRGNIEGCGRPSVPRVDDRLLQGHCAGVGLSRARTGGKCTPLTTSSRSWHPSFFVTTDGKQTSIIIQTV